MGKSKMQSTLVSSAESDMLTVKWGAFEVKGLDPKRAEAIGLQMFVKKVGYGSSSQELPPYLKNEGTVARYCRRTAELMLQTSEFWEQIELKTRDTNQYYKELLTHARVQYDAYATATDILAKIKARPGLLNVWELSCPQLLTSKKRELELQEAGTPVYLETLKELTRIELVYDAVVALKNIEQDRPIRDGDIAEHHTAVAARAAVEQKKIMDLEASLAQELREIGDGTETVVAFAHRLEASLASNVLSLRAQRLLGVPSELFQLVHVEVLDLAANRIAVLPSEVCMMTKLKKLYLDDNKLTTLPSELHKLGHTLTLLGVANNPLDPQLLQLYFAGLPVLLAHLKAIKPMVSSMVVDPNAAPLVNTMTSTAPRKPFPPVDDVGPFDLFSTTLPDYPPPPSPEKTRRSTIGL